VRIASGSFSGLISAPTLQVSFIKLDSFVNSVNAYKASQRELDIWVGESHSEPQGNYLAIQLNAKIKFQNFIKETCNVANFL
jgi:hypothetical protein